MKAHFTIESEFNQTVASASLHASKWNEMQIAALKRAQPFVDAEQFVLADIYSHIGPFFNNCTQFTCGRGGHHIWISRGTERLAIITVK